MLPPAEAANKYGALSMEGFKVVRRDEGTVSILYLKGFLDAHTAPGFETELKNLSAERRYKIVVNCKELTYISSAGLGVFMGFIEDVRSHGGDIKISNLMPKVYKVFDLLGFPTIYEIMNDEKDCINKFNSKQ